jgi:hypothetical protein
MTRGAACWRPVTLAGVCLCVAAPRAQAALPSPNAAVQGTPSLESDGSSEDDAARADGPRRWSASAGAGLAMVTEGGAGFGFTFEGFAHPWGRSGIGGRLDVAMTGAQMLAEGARYSAVLMTLGYAYQWPAAREKLTGASIDFLVGPTFGMASRTWSEGLCLDFDGDGCESSRPDDFESYERPVVGLGGSVSPNLHVWHVVLGAYVTAAAGLASGEGFLQVQAGLRLGAGDL